MFATAAESFVMPDLPPDEVRMAIKTAIRELMDEAISDFSSGFVRWLLHLIPTAVVGGLIWWGVTKHWPALQGK